MQRLEFSCAVRRIYTSLGAKGLIIIRRMVFKRLLLMKPGMLRKLGYATVWSLSLFACRTERRIVGISCLVLKETLCGLTLCTFVGGY